MIRSTEDKVYSILADALPIGNGRCQKRGERHAVCDACLARRATTVRETCRHAHLECPSVEVVLAIAYLAAIQVASSDAAARARARSLSTAALVHEHRRLLVAGVDGGGGGGVGGWGAGPTEHPRAIWFGEVHVAIDERRWRNSQREDLAEIEDDAAACYLRARGAMARHVRFSRQVAEADERVLRIRYPDWDQAESGPWQDWLRTWVKGGWATEGGALLLPEAVADVAGQLAYSLTSPSLANATARASRLSS